MFSNLAATLTLSLGLLSTTSAAAVETRQASDSGSNVWSISNYDASCAFGRCKYYFQIDGYGTDSYPSFTAICQATGVPRASKSLMDCRVTNGATDGVQSVSAYMELTPRRPNNPSEFYVQVGFLDQYSSTVTYYSASQYGNYASWRDYSVSGSQAGQFDVYPALGTE